MHNPLFHSIFGALSSLSFCAFAAANPALPGPPDGTERIAAVFDAPSLEATMKKGMFGLPQLYIVDLKTGALANEQFLPDELKTFASAHRTPEPTRSVHGTDTQSLLAALIEVSRHADGTPLRREELGDKRFAAFQLWADWCVGCLEEAKDLSDLLKQRPMPELAWVALEADPTKGKADVVHVKGAHDLRGPHGKPIKLDANGAPIIGADGQFVEQ